jgi:hypothetical protein
MSWCWIAWQRKRRAIQHPRAWYGDLVADGDAEPVRVRRSHGAVAPVGLGCVTT